MDKLDSDTLRAIFDEVVNRLSPPEAAVEAPEDPPESVEPIKKKRLTIKEVCHQEGVSRSTVNRWFREGLPVIRKGRFVRVDVDDLEAFLSRYKVGRQDLTG